VESLRGGLPSDRAGGEAFDAYREAYEAYFNRSDSMEARGHLVRAIDLAPREALYRFVAALLDLSAGELGRAREGFDRCLSLGHPDPERVAGFALWKGRTHDRLGDRREAIAWYRAAGGGDPAVRRAARRGLSRRWRGGKIVVEFIFADVVRP
jgi:tetratricopeptide (TPR) repeat protein